MIEIDYSKEIKELQRKITELEKKQSIELALVQKLDLDNYIRNLTKLLNDVQATALYDKPVICKLNGETIISISLNEGDHWLDIHEDRVILRSNGDHGFKDIDTVHLPRRIEFFQAQAFDKEDESGYYNYISVSNIIDKLMDIIRTYDVELPIV